MDLLITDKSESNYCRVILGWEEYRIFSNTEGKVSNPFSGEEGNMKCFLEEMAPLIPEAEEQLSK